MPPESKITNTESLPPEAHLVSMVALGSSAAIESSEAQGQRELVATSQDDWSKIPVEGNDEDLIALGIELGDPVEGDDLFRYARLPEGWTIDATGHSMWSTIRDAEGFERASIFYKAAFYDRNAHIGVTRVPRTKAQEEATNAFRDTRERCMLRDSRSNADRSVTYTFECMDEDYRTVLAAVTVNVAPDGTLVEEAPADA